MSWPDLLGMPGEKAWSLMISHTKTELLEVAVQHAVAVHNHPDTPELLDQIKHAMEDVTPPVESPRHAGHRGRHIKRRVRSRLGYVVVADVGLVGRGDRPAALAIRVSVCVVSEFHSMPVSRA